MSSVDDLIVLMTKVIKCCPKVVTSPDVFKRNMASLGYPDVDPYSLQCLDLPIFRLAHAASSRIDKSAEEFLNSVLEAVKTVKKFKYPMDFIRSFYGEEMTPEELNVCFEFSIRHRLGSYEIVFIVRCWQVGEERVPLDKFLVWVENNCRDLGVSLKQLSSLWFSFKPPVPMKNIFELIHEFQNIELIDYMASGARESKDSVGIVWYVLKQVTPKHLAASQVAISRVCRITNDTSRIIDYSVRMIKMMNEYSYESLSYIVEKVYKQGTSLTSLLNLIEKILETNKHRLKDIPSGRMIHFIKSGVFQQE